MWKWPLVAAAYAVPFTLYVVSPYPFDRVFIAVYLLLVEVSLIAPSGLRKGVAAIGALHLGLLAGAGVLFPIFVFLTYFDSLSGTPSAKYLWGISDPVWCNASDSCPWSPRVPAWRRS